MAMTKRTAIYKCTARDAVNCAKEEYANLSCRYCGFEEEEAERRKALPTVAGFNGLSRKYVAVERGAER